MCAETTVSITVPWALHVLSAIRRMYAESIATIIVIYRAALLVLLLILRAVIAEPACPIIPAKVLMPNGLA